MLRIVLVALMALAGVAQTAKRPNEVVILTDDPRWDCLNCAGHPHRKPTVFYTPNVRGVRTDGWKFIPYPHGDDKPARHKRHKAELYLLQTDHQEQKNLVDDSKYAPKLKELQAELERLLRRTGAPPNRMPLDPEIKQVLPDLKIR